MLSLVREQTSLAFGKSELNGNSRLRNLNQELLSSISMNYT